MPLPRKLLLTDGRRRIVPRKACMPPALIATAKTATAMAGTTQTTTMTGIEMTGIELANIEVTGIEMAGIGPLAQMQQMVTDTAGTEAGTPGTVEKGTDPGVNLVNAALGMVQAPLVLGEQKMNGR